MSSRFHALVAVLAIGVSVGGLPAQPADTVAVFVARTELRQGTFIREPLDLFKKVRAPRDVVPPSAIRDMDQLKNKVIERTLDERQIVLALDVGEPRKAPELPLGTRAIVIRTATDAAVGGFILPGSRVDVILLADENGKSISKVIVQDVTALDVSTDDTMKVKLPPILVTLAVKPEQAEVLAKAAGKGKLTLVLRRPDDKK